MHGIMSTPFSQGLFSNTQTRKDTLCLIPFMSSVYVGANI